MSLEKILNIKSDNSVKLIKNINLAQIIRNMYGDDENILLSYDEEKGNLKNEDIETIIFLVDNAENIQYSRDISIGNHIISEHITEIAIAKNDLNLLNILIDKEISIPYLAMKIESAIEFTNTELLKILIKECTDISPFLLKLRYDGIHYDRPSLSVEDAEKIMNILLDNGADINIKNKMGMTALMLYSFLGKDKLVKILLERGADTSIKTELRAIDLAMNEEVKNLINMKVNNNSQKLVQLLTNFRQDTPIKYTTHLWDMNFKDEYKDFDGYMKKVKEQWNLIEDELKTLSPRLHKIIYNFLLNDDEENAIWYNYNNEKLNIGWSSLKGLREWCNDGNDPFKFQLEKECRVNNQTLKTFGEVITLFKQEIQIRRENNVLENIFIDIEERLDEEVEGVFEFELVKLKGKTFYTDVMVFKDVLHKIFEMVKSQPKHNKIKIMIEEDSNDSYYELKIIQEDSLSGKTAKDMLNIVNGGDFSIIKESLTNLCDFSIESSYEDENYRINYLSSMNENDIEILKDKPQGFTYMLRFYR